MNLQPLQSNLKVLQEQQTQIKNSMLQALSLVEFWRLLDAIDSVCCAIARGDCVHGCKSFLEPCTCFFGMVVERSKSATVHNHARFIDDVNALGPSAICEVRGLLHVIHADRQREVEALDEIVGDRHSLDKRLRLGVTNALVHVALHLPFVLRMCFANIDGQKVCLRFVIVVKIYEVAYLAPEWRSGITSKNENQRALPDAIA